MSSPDFASQPLPTVAVAGSGRRFAVHRVFCVGRNYEEHAKEMGVSTREPPFFFTKFPWTIVPSGSRITYPPSTRDFHYEGELVIALGKGGRDVAVEGAMGLVFGFAAGLDMTRRDLQLEARGKGRPWDTGKNFEQSAPIGEITPAERAGAMSRGELALSVNGTVRQRADLATMIWNVPEIVSHLSKLYTLQPGDLIYTGTPAGVGAVVPGDEVEVRIEGLAPLEVTIGDAAPAG
jgi:fumarylpyruvate hydrolase